jgi:hypothetical protein
MLHRNTVLLWEDILISESCFCSRHKELCLDFATDKKHLKSFGKHYWNCYCEFIDCKRKNKSNSNMIALTRPLLPSYSRASSSSTSCPRRIISTKKSGLLHSLLLRQRRKPRHRNSIKRHPYLYVSISRRGSKTIVRSSEPASAKANMTISRT